MEQEYLIGVTNKFAAFFDEGEDPYDIIKSVEAERQKKKALKATVSNDNKENTSDAKNKSTKKNAAPKSADRVLTGSAKTENTTERANNRRNKEEVGEAPRGNNRDGNKTEGTVPRGPRNDNRDGPRGDRRDNGPRPFRGDGERDRERRGPRPDGESRPYRPREGQGSDVEGRPPRRERRDFANDSDFESRPERRAPRGRGGPRPPGRNFDNRGKREFDRRSGSDRTGVKPVEKRDGAGSFNWDSTKDPEAFMPDANETNISDEPDWDAANQEAEGAPAPKENDENTDEVPAPVEEEPQELTLDEYRKLRGQRERPKYDIRKPGEGEDLSQWKNLVEYKKKNTEDEEGEELEVSEFPQRAGRQKHVVGIDITFNDSFRGGRGRGRGRGGPREPREGRESREGAQRRFAPRDRDRDDRREDRSKPLAPKVDDVKAFPSLG